jgi:predicted O-methyltransferase YrrM
MNEKPNYRITFFTTENEKVPGYRHRHFLGIRQQHTYWLYKVIDDILNENKQIKGIIEIGTAEGALSVFLGLECYERGLKPLLTYDIKKYKEPRLFKLLGIKSIIRDCFHEDSIREITGYADSPILLICDNGNKIKEFNTFVRFLKKDSVIASHDWEHTIKLASIKDSVDKYALKPLHEDEWNSPPEYIKTCFWRKTL